MVEMKEARSLTSDIQYYSIVYQTSMGSIDPDNYSTRYFSRRIDQWDTGDTHVNKSPGPPDQQNNGVSLKTRQGSLTRRIQARTFSATMLYLPKHDTITIGRVDDTMCDSCTFTSLYMNDSVVVNAPVTTTRNHILLEKCFGRVLECQTFDHCPNDRL